MLLVVDFRNKIVAATIGGLSFWITIRPTSLRRRLFSRVIDQ